MEENRMADNEFPESFESETNESKTGGLYQVDRSGGLGEQGIEKVAQLEEELYQLKKEQGLIPEKKGLSKVIQNFFDSPTKKTVVNRKKYIKLACFLGIFGAHRFYSKHYKSAIVYLLTCWLGISFAHTIIDLIIVLPMKPDENGNIEI